jgi:hypothetical protein
VRVEPTRSSLVRNCDHVFATAAMPDELQPLCHRCTPMRAIASFTLCSLTFRGDRRRAGREAAGAERRPVGRTFVTTRALFVSACRRPRRPAPDADGMEGSAHIRNSGRRFRQPIAAGHGAASTEWPAMSAKLRRSAGRAKGNGDCETERRMLPPCAAGGRGGREPLNLEGTNVRRLFKDALVSASALLIVLVALMAVDHRVREQITVAMSGAASPEAVVAAGGQVSYVTGVLLSAAREQSIDHAPIVIFVAAASVLVIFMLRL